MNLRPHHLLCIQKFTGHGYNAAFTAHMTSIVSQLTDRPETGITIVQGCDELCRECPNNADNTCTSLEKVTFMDSAVLDVCRLTRGETASWAELADKARKQIFKTEEFYKICSCCQWFSLCRSTEVHHE